MQGTCDRMMLGTGYRPTTKPYIRDYVGGPTRDTPSSKSGNKARVTCGCVRVCVLVCVCSAHCQLMRGGMLWGVKGGCVVAN